MRLHGNMGKRQNLEGKRFGRLTAVSPTEKRESTGCVKWLCKCDCGRETIVSVNALNMGNTKSCGCLHIDTIRRLNLKEKGVAAMTQVYNSYKGGARARELPFLLSKDYFSLLTKRVCFYCGAPPKNLCNPKGANGSYTYTGIDRVDNTKGYLPENVVPCCDLCNTAKNQLNQIEFLRLVKNIYENLNLQFFGI